MDLLRGTLAVGAWLCFNGEQFFDAHYHSLLCLLLSLRSGCGLSLYTPKHSQECSTLVLYLYQASCGIVSSTVDVRLLFLKYVAIEIASALKFWGGLASNSITLVASNYMQLSLSSALFCSGLLGACCQLILNPMHKPPSAQVPMASVSQSHSA